MNRIMVVWVIWCFILPVFANESPSIQWSDPQNSLALQQARAFFDRKELPVVETVVRSATDISINGKTAITHVTKIVYLPTFKEANDSGTQTFYWDYAVQELTIHEATVVTSDGQHRRMDVRNIRVRDTDTYNTFTNSKEVVIPLSGLVDNSVTVLEYTLKTQLIDLESQYSDVFYPVGFSSPVETFELRVKTDNAFDIDWSNSHPKVACEFAERELWCSGNDLNAYPYESTIQWRDELPQIVVAQKTDWQGVIEHVHSAFDKSNYQSQEVKKFADSLIKDAEGLNDKIHIFHEFASRGVRYVSMSELGNRITPHSFDHVVSNLFGDCKDKSALLVGLLQTIGVDAVPVLVATQRRDPSVLEVASSAYFDHMVVCFELDGKRYCLDPTDNNTHWTSVSSWVQGRVSLALEEGAVPSTLPLQDHKWSAAYDSHSEFNSDASVNEEQTRSFNGVYAGWYRNALLGMTEQERDEWLVANYHSNVSNLANPTFTIANLSTQDSNVTINSSTSYQPYIAADEVLNLSEQDSWLRAEIIGSQLNDSSKYGTWIDGSHITSTVNYNFDKNWRVTRLPAELDFEGDGISLKRTVTKESDTGNIQIVTQFSLKSQFVKPENIKKHNTQLEIFKEASNLHFEGSLKAKE